MNALLKRLHEIEDRRAFRQFQMDNSIFKGRTRDELRFFSIHGYFPEAADGDLPERQEFAVGGIRTVVTTEKS